MKLYVSIFFFWLAVDFLSCAFVKRKEARSYSVHFQTRPKKIQVTNFQILVKKSKFCMNFEISI